MNTPSHQSPSTGILSVLVAAIDDSAVAQHVLAAALALAPYWNANVVAVHVGDGTGRNARAAARRAGVPLESPSGDAVAHLLEYTRDDSVVALVVGARGRPGGRMPAGHVAQELLRQCAKPVVVVPPDMEGTWALRRVVVALEGDAPCSAMLAPLFGWAHDNDLDIVAVHVHEEPHLPRFADQEGHETDAFASEFLARHAPEARPHAHLELRVGVPAEQVLGVADEIDADLIAVAWSRRLEPGRARFVSHVLEHGRIPVLLLPVS
jgi:nucleotide-binding universal stress UspA family protein